MIAILLSALIVVVIAFITTIIYYENVLLEKDQMLNFGNKLVDIYREHNSKRAYEIEKLIKENEDFKYEISKLHDEVNVLKNNFTNKFVIEIHSAKNNEIYYIIKYKSNGKVYLRTSETYKNKSFLRQSAIEMAELLNCDLINKEN